MAAWQLQQAKARFSELVQKAIDEGPQTITRRGRKAVVVLSVKDLERLQEKRPSLLEVIMSGPEGALELPERTLQAREIDW